MPTRIVIGGRVVASSPVAEPPRPLRFYKPRDVEVLADPRVPREEAPFRAGLPFYDPDDGVEYRSVSAKTLDPRDGWRTADFWLSRWSVSWTTLRRLKDLGWLDAAIESTGATKRFRCRDERKVLEWIGKQKLLAAQAAISARHSTASSSVARSARSR